MLLTYQPSKQPLDPEYTQEPASYQQQVDDVETTAVRKTLVRKLANFW